MEMKTCSNCLRLVSFIEKECPRCGKEEPFKRPFPVSAFTLLCVVVAVLLGLR